MTPTELLALLPEIIVALAAVAALLSIAVKRHHGVTCAITCLGLVAAITAGVMQMGHQGIQVTPLIAADAFGRFFVIIVLGASLAVTILAYAYLREWQGHREEFYVVLLTATLGSAVLAGANHFVSLFLGLELLSVSLYVMIAYVRDSIRSLEAGVKYLILAAVSSAFLLFGMALIYLWSGTMEFPRLAGEIAGERSGFLVATGIVLLLVGAGYKLALVPFHMWAPDVYQGAPAPVTAFIATVPKVAVMGMLLRFFIESGAYSIRSVNIVIAVIATASMIAGNMLALNQLNVKRLLAYSSIAHMGYMLVAFVAGGALGVESIGYYVAAYVVTSLGAFGVVSLLSRGTEERMNVDSYLGLFWRRPWLALVMTAMLLSLAGIPLTAGFIGKFLVLAAGIGASLWTLTIILVINSAISLYYYLRIVVAMFSRPDEADLAGLPAVGAMGNLLLVFLLLALLVLGVQPAPLLRVLGEVASAVM